MTAYFVRTTGSDAAAGTTAGAAFLTIGKALDTCSGAGGHTIDVGAGIYREQFDFGTAANDGTFSAEVILRGDWDGSQTGDPGAVIWSGYDNGATSAPSGNACLRNTSASGGTDNLTIQKIDFVAAHAQKAIDSVTGFDNLKLHDCTFHSRAQHAVELYQISATAWTLEIKRCTFLHTHAFGRVLTLWTDVSGTYTVNVDIENCQFMGGFGTSEAAASLLFEDVGSGGSVDGFAVTNCQFISCGRGIGVDGSGWASGGVVVRNSYLLSVGMDADSTTPIDEDYNAFNCTTARQNVTAGGNSITSGANEFLMEIGSSFQRPSRRPVPFGSFLAGTTCQRIGAAGSNSGDPAQPTDDILGNPRPIGNIVDTVGCYAPNDTATENTSPPSGSGAQSWKFTGPGIQDFAVAVDSGLNTCTVEVQWDGTYTGTKPSMLVLDGGEAGVSDAEDVATGSSGSWETLTLAFTAASDGIVTIRFESGDTNGAGVADFSNFAVA